MVKTVKTITAIKTIKPLFNRLLVTAEQYDEDIKEGALVIKTAGTLKEYQKVIAIGSTVKDIKVGDMVMINPIRYAVKKHETGSLKDGVITDNPVVRYNFNTVLLGDTPYILLYDTDIDYIIEEYDSIDTFDTIIHPTTSHINIIM